MSFNSFINNIVNHKNVTQNKIFTAAPRHTSYISQSSCVEFNIPPSDIHHA